MDLKVKRNYQSDDYLPIVVLFYSNLPKTNNQPNKQHKVIQFCLLTSNKAQKTEK